MKGNGFRNFWQRMSAGLLERLTDNPVVSELQAHLLLARANLPMQSDKKRLDALLKACRRMAASPSRRLLRAQLLPFVAGHKSDLARRERVGWERYYGDFGELRAKKALTTSLVLKAPGA